MNISASGLTAQRLRMDIISQNIANAQTTRTPEGGPYKRRTVIFQEINGKDPFASLFSKKTELMENEGRGVRVSQVAIDESPGILMYDPFHPDADGEGYVRMPNVNIIEEMVNMISASRSYEANITAINSSKAMLAKTLELGR
ncbi:MAG: flagellar basal body rod protein FlgC [Defluviitaleaceae bacterium]|nr:flagellar basal body rod protein FlgC [Defluviitaleaceae bacterium]